MLEPFVGRWSRRAIARSFRGSTKRLGITRCPHDAEGGAVPHGACSPRCRAVIHHCGFGTAAMAMACGIPSVPVPHVLDQMGFDRICTGWAWAQSRCPRQN